ncbi:hypothetical protein Mal15_23250 [Stieleria maiorica]|uniref:Uncharacterized protein n=1 Tax=Stieleria maiorica TaxID=2795974 RepID=A0A5B9MFD5_9BACT|nr:hypothetical protein [Stieleria maiorica]QEF98275.1 hypothetical protein Mal15_23250 [Stieleria maiorica]
MKRTRSPEALYAELSQVLTEGTADEALNQLDEICRSSPDDGGAFELRGLLAAQTGRPNLAVHYLEHADRLLPLEPLSYRILAHAYSGIGRDKQAVELLHRLAINHADLPWYNRLLARDLLCQGYPELATDALYQGVAFQPREDASWHDLSAAQSVQGDPPSTCLRSVARAIALAPETVEYRVTASNLLIRMDEPLAAYQTVCQVITADQCDLDCECCLWRLIYLFDCFDDHPRMSCCYRRLKSMMMMMMP